ncbi:type IV pilus modification PilV family protein [Psychromonas sp. B3M02]|uniref:type IV pilus modification PilV family protein n=1 Tax=Psychromonas sp. B3M02 TaxID=2267226 RepID=UPI0015F03A29|nr:prepilin-type N-terminal cleavage/methylation domain-containing protein [Psychromonas sp. B3M02]
MNKENQGFTFVEILVSLIVISLTALNMSGLQIKIAQQQNKNIAHAQAISLASTKLEGLLKINDVDDLLALHQQVETDITLASSVFSIEWEIKSVADDFNANNQFKEINLHVSWSNSLGEVEGVVYSQQINMASILSEQFEQQVKKGFSNIVAPSTTLNEILYFDPNKTYQVGDFVIYNSHLYQTNGLYSQLSTPLISGSDNSELEVVGWDSHEQVDQLNLFDKQQEE